MPRCKIWGGDCVMEHPFCYADEEEIENNELDMGDDVS